MKDLLLELHQSHTAMLLRMLAMCTSTRLGCDLHSAYTSACLQEVCAPGTAPITVQIIDTTSSNLQLDSADITAVSSQGNRLGHVGVSVEQVGVHLKFVRVGCHHAMLGARCLNLTASGLLILLVQ